MLESLSIVLKLSVSDEWNEWYLRFLLSFVTEKYALKWVLSIVLITGNTSEIQSWLSWRKGMQKKDAPNQLYVQLLKVYSFAIASK